MDIFINSFLLVFAGEMGDKTQLLALLLVTRFKEPWTILFGIFVATFFNHMLATYMGVWAAGWFEPKTLSWILAGTFFVFGLWVLKPDEVEEEPKSYRFDVLTTTILTFFLAEMGDKTQLATVALGARYQAPVLVTFSTTMGMMASNALAVFLGAHLLKVVPMKWVRIFTCALFMITGLAIVMNSFSK